MERKRILITGGCGFIGSNFIQKILQEEEAVEVFNLDKLTYASNIENLETVSSLCNYNFVEGDICDQNLVKEVLFKNQINFLINFAAESHVDNSIENPNDFINTNINGTFNLLNCSLRYVNENNKLTFLHVSTDEVYGSLELGEKPFSESNKIEPNSPYSASKASSDMLVRAWNKTYNLPILITNCSNNFGPFQHFEKFIPSIIKSALNHDEIKIYGDGKNIRDWIFVEDHCDALMSIIEKGIIGETYNIGADNEYSNLEIANKVCSLLERKKPISKNKFLGKITSYKDLIKFVKDRPGHDFRYGIDSQKIKSLTGWFPKTSFDYGLEKTVDWYIKQYS